MEKNLTKWNKRKIQIDSRKERPFFKEREIWWLALGENVGSEQNGKGRSFRRPVLVYKKFNTELFWAIPLSEKIKENNPYYMPIILEDGSSESAITSQMRPLDAKRLLKRMGIISKEEHQRIRKAVIDLC
ncbi:MAG: hypothetical protein JWM39_229 [Parcubacteria group bacterium]|jgi:mRNA interferase MazF|nr:hypothetical protein [Parcubacteria group bacterium]